MPTWEELKDYARTNYTLAVEEKGFFGVNFAFPDGRTQKIIVRVFKAFDLDWIELRSPVCGEKDINPTAALRKSADFSVGSLVLVDDLYWLQYSLVLKNLDPEEFDLPFRVIAMAADRLEETFTAGDEY